MAQFARPHAMKFQLAPCQTPVASQTAKDEMYTGSRRPAQAPSRRRENLVNFYMGLQMDSG